MVGQSSRARQFVKRAARVVANAMLSIPGVHGVGRCLARSGHLPERVWAGYPLTRAVTFRLQGVAFRYEVRPGDYVGMPLYWRGAAGYEPETFAAIKERLGKASVFLDVGANTGLFSLFAAALNPDAAVWAFEPSPETGAQLRRNIALNDFGDRVRIVDAAVSDVVGTAEFYMPDAVFATSASLSPSGNSVRPDRKLVARTETLDNFCRSSPLPDFVKIDIEGWEANALAGMQGMLAACKPDILLEVLDDAPRERLEALLKPHGYRFGHITDRGIVWHDNLAHEAVRLHRNWLCAAATGR